MPNAEGSSSGNSWPRLSVPSAPPLHGGGAVRIAQRRLGEAVLRPPGAAHLSKSAKALIRSRELLKVTRIWRMVRVSAG